MDEIKISGQELELTYQRLKKEAEASGYYLNPDMEFTKDVINGILVNEKRYGYWGCPCRISARDRKKDLDIICPCDYRDADLQEFGQCYCALYVSQEIAEGKKNTHPIPERRESGEEKVSATDQEIAIAGKLSYPVWRCKVCGYICARSEPPLKCPICKADKDRFERYI